jgi:GxxExxY protein
MVYELRESGLNAQEQVEIPLRYKRLDVESAYRLDILVERELVLELKAVDQFEPVHTAQLLTYLKSGGFRLGLLLNFNVDSMRKGIKRVVNGL